MRLLPQRSNAQSDQFILRCGHLRTRPGRDTFSERRCLGVNEAANPVHQFNWTNPDGTKTVVWSPDPGRALITGRIDQIGPASDLNSFKIPSLWGVKNTAPYFHDNSAKTLEDVAAHYARFFVIFPPPQILLTPEDQADIVAYMKLLE